MFNGKVPFLFDLILLIIVFLSVFYSPAQANPIGPVVVAGSASVQNTLSLTTVHQSSNATIINWQSFSINPGQTTQFLQPGSQSVALNRVLGGGRSILNGNLFSNGQVFLINQDGILVGPHGVIDATAFTASTQGLNDTDFLNGKLQFFGHSRAGVVNRGAISGSLGDVVLIGKTVDNRSQIKASNGTVGLIAGNNVLLGQKNADGTTITVDPSRLKKSDLNEVGVENNGSIQSAAAELKAANGNIYSLAIQNTGIVRATNSRKQGGHIWLTSDTGTVSNSGSLNVSARAIGGKGGSIILEDNGGTTVESGQIIAEGGQGGIGGNAEVSGKVVKYSGTVNLLAPGGTTGNLLFDPYSVTIETGTATGNSNFAAAQNDSVFYTVDLENALSGANVTVSTGTSGAQSGDITVANDLTWTQGTTLNLSAANNIYLNADITASSGGLTLNAGSNISSGNEGLSGSILSNVNVGSFILQNGSWVQNANGGSLPTFMASNDFELQNSTSFLRVAGGNGSTGNPYQVTDVFGLQGVGSPSNAYLSSNIVLTNNVDATGTATWNGGSGFVPIGGNFNGTNAYNSTFNGFGYTIGNLTISRPSQSLIGLFGYTNSNALIENVGLTGGSISGDIDTGCLVGVNVGTVKLSYATGDVNGIRETGGLVGENDGTILTSYATGTVSGSSDAGGLVGLNYDGTIETSYASGVVTGTSYAGGLLGYNEASGIVKTSYATGAVSGSVGTGGLAGENDLNCIVETCYETGSVTTASGGTFTGGLIGENGGTVETSYATGNVIGFNFTGGLVGGTNGTVETSYATGAVSGHAALGGLVGSGGVGTVKTSYWATDAPGQTPGLQTFGSNGASVDIYTSGKTLAQLSKTATFLTSGTGVPNWDFTNTWTTNGDTTTPLLRALSVNLSGATVGNTDSVELIGNGNIRFTTSAVAGNYSFFVPDDVVTSGALLTDATGTPAAATYYIAGPIPTSDITGVNLTADTLHVQGTGVASNLKLGAAYGSLTGNGINYSVSNSNLTTNSGVGLSIASTYSLDGNITTNGELSTTSDGALIGNNNITLSAPNMNLAGSLNVPAVVTFNSTGLINAPGTVQVYGFVLQNGSWVQNANGGTLPTFTASNDFELQHSSSFLRVAGGDGSTGNPYQITDVYGLQGLGSLTSGEEGTYISGNVVLNNNVDATGTATWNHGSGFVPIGGNFDGHIPFIGTFNGAGHSINALTINRPTQSDIGLLGYTGSGAIIENVGLTGGLTSGINNTGALVGLNEGNVSTSYMTGEVNGITNTGGLVGSNQGTVEASYATGAVTGGNGSTFTGGLVGYNIGNLAECYATGTVTAESGSMFTGGLVGGNQGGMIETSYATGAVTAQNGNVGGLVGINSATIETSYAMGAVTAGSTSSSTGGLVGVNDGGEVNTSYSTGTVTVGSGSSMTGGLVGANEGGTVNTSYSTGAVTSGNGSYLTGGLVGINDGGIVQGSYWAQNTGFNTGLFGIGTGTDNTGSNVGASPETFAQLAQQGTFQPSGTGPSNWDFTLGTGVWGINGYGSSGLINNGLPYFQWQYATQAQIIPLDQALVYSGTTGTPNQALGAAYSVNYASIYNGNLSPFLANAPVFTVHGSNVNVMNSGAVNTIATALSVNPGYAVELANNVATATYVPYALTVTPSSGQSVQYGASGANFTYSVGSALNGDVVTEGGSLGGYTQYTDSVVNGPSHLITLGSLTSNNTNYSVSLASTPVNYLVATKPITLSAVTLTSPGVAYGNTPIFSNDGVAGQLVNGDSLNGTITYSNTDKTSSGGYLEAGTYSYTPVITGYNANYSVTTQSAAFTINPLSLTLSGVANKVYDGTTAATLSGLTISPLSGDSVSLNTSSISGTFSDANAGTEKVVTLQGIPVLVGVDASNYQLSVPSPTANISPKAIILSAGSLSSITYGNTPSFSNNGVVGQLFNGTSLGGTIGYSTTDSASSGGYLNSGTYTYTPVLTGYNPNYSVTTQPATFTIKPATLSYVANPAAGFVGQTPSSLGGTVEGLLPNDVQAEATSGTLTFSVSATSSSPAGYYPIIGSGLGAFNYIFTQSSENNDAFYLIPTSNTPPPPIRVFDPAEHSQEYDRAFYHAYQHGLLDVHAHAKKKAHAKLHASLLY